MKGLTYSLFFVYKGLLVQITQTKNQDCTTKWANKKQNYYSYA